MKGLDVSSYQGKIDWKKVAEDGYQFTILRGVIKSGNLDSTFFFNYENAADNGFDISCYQYSYALSETEGASAARNMIAKLRGIKIPIWLDLEWDTQGFLGKDAVTNIAGAYIKTCQAAGYECHIYSNLYWYHNKYNPDELRQLGCRFWIARYSYGGGYVENLKPNVGEQIWQWTSSGSVNGIKGNVDLNLSYEAAEKARNLKKGMKGEDVKQLQQQLNNKKFSCGNVDGIFGTKTDAAVKAFQKANQLVVDGIAGPRTMQKLK